MEECSFNYQGIQVHYTLFIKDVKNINLRVNNKGNIIVSANSKVSRAVIDKFVQSKAEWIFRKLASFERVKELEIDSDINNGKSVYFLGNEYIINIIKSSFNRVEISDNKINIYTNKPEDNKINKKIYINWLTERSKTKFENILDKVMIQVKDYNIQRPEIYVRNMTTRWGSCIPSKKKIGLNLQLIKADERCIEQVILHELIHFIHPNHSKNFYFILTQIMPDWKDRKNDLDTKFKDGI